MEYTQRFTTIKWAAKFFNISQKRVRALHKKGMGITKLFDAGYSMGGTVSIVLVKKTRNRTLRLLDFAVNDTRTYYSRICKYREKHSEHYIILTISELESTYIPYGEYPIYTSSNTDKLTQLTPTGRKQSYTIKPVYI